MPAPKIRYGGSFAPPLTDESLRRYAELVATLDPAEPAGDYARRLLECCRVWWGLPESAREGRPHPSGPLRTKDGRAYEAPLEVPLEDEHQKKLWELIPWRHELDLYGAEFDRLDPKAQKELRDCCFHLLWHARELERDREPITLDKLKEMP